MGRGLRRRRCVRSLLRRRTRLRLLRVVGRGLSTQTGRRRKGCAMGWEGVVAREGRLRPRARAEGRRQHCTMRRRRWLAGTPRHTGARRGRARRGTRRSYSAKMRDAGRPAAQTLRMRLTLAGLAALGRRTRRTTRAPPIAATPLPRGQRTASPCDCTSTRVCCSSGCVSTCRVCVASAYRRCRDRETTGGVRQEPAQDNSVVTAAHVPCVGSAVSSRTPSVASSR